MKKALFCGVAVAIAAALAFPVLMAIPVQAQPMFHGATILKTVAGPGGAAQAREGDTVTAYIRVTNTDDFGCALTINEISDVVHHASGDVATGNLLAGPVTLVSKGDYVDLSHSYMVEVGDYDPLRDSATCIGVDAVVGEFTLTFPGLIDVEPLEVGGTALPVDKLSLMAPWMVLAGCLGVLPFLVIRKKRQA